MGIDKVPSTMTNENQAPVHTERVVVITSTLMSFITVPQAVAILFATTIGSTIIAVDLASIRSQYFLGAIVCAGILTLLYRWFIYLSTDKVLFADLYHPKNDTTFSKVRPLLTAFQLIGRIVCGTLFTISAGYYLLYTFSSIYFSFGGTENIEAHFNWIVSLFSVTLLFLQWRSTVRGKEENRKRTIMVSLVSLNVFFFFIIWVLLKYFEQDLIHLPKSSFFTSQPISNFTEVIILTVSLLFLFSNEDILWQIHRELEAPKQKNYRNTFIYVTFITLIVFAIAAIIIREFSSEYFQLNWKYATYLGLLSAMSQSDLVGTILRVSFTFLVLFVMLNGLHYTNRQAENQLAQLADNGYLPNIFKKLHKKYGTNSIILVSLFLFQLILAVSIYGNILLLAQIAAFAVGGGIIFTLLDFEIRLKQSSHPPHPLISTNESNPSKQSIFYLRLSGIGLLLLIVPAILYVAFTALPDAALIAFLMPFGLALLAAQTKRPFQKKKSISSSENHEYELTESIGVSKDQLAIASKNPILIAARHPQGLHHLRKVLTEHSVEKDEVVVMTVRITRENLDNSTVSVFGRHEKTLFHEVFRVAQECGTTVIPIVVSGTNSFEAIILTALNLKAREIVLGLSGKVQLDQQIDEFNQLWGKHLSSVEQQVTLRIITPRQEIVHQLELPKS